MRYILFFYLYLIDWFIYSCTYLSIYVSKYFFIYSFIFSICKASWEDATYGPGEDVKVTGGSPENFKFKI